MVLLEFKRRIKSKSISNGVEYIISEITLKNWVRIKLKQICAPTPTHNEWKWKNENLSLAVEGKNITSTIIKGDFKSKLGKKA